MSQESPSAVIRAEPDGYNMGKDALMGRQSAGWGFLRAAVEARGDQPIFGYTPTASSANGFKQILETIDPTTPFEWVHPDHIETIGRVGVLYIGDPTLPRYARMRDRGVTTKRRTAGSGRVMGGQAWREGPLYYFLKNRLYRGDIVHKGKVHEGQHEAIVDEALFDAVQARLAVGNRRRVGDGNPTMAAALVGKIFDDRGHPMSPITARRGARTYRYYASQAVIRKDRGEAGSLQRIPAYAIEALIESQLSGRRARGSAVKIERVLVSKSAVELTLRELRSDGETSSEVAVVRIPITLKTWGGAKRLIRADDPSSTHSEPDEALLRAIARGRRWEAQLATGERAGADDIAAAEGVQSRYVDKLVKLAWLAPDIVDKLLEGRRLREGSLTSLIGQQLPLSWDEQRKVLLLL